MVDEGTADVESCPSDTALAGRGSACEGCPGQKLCQQNADTPDPLQRSIARRMKPIAHKILILSGKGGVGKSTLTAALAQALSSKGRKVGVADVDICGPSMPRLLGCDESSAVIKSQYGWMPATSTGGSGHGIKVISAQVLLPKENNAIIWRGPRKSQLVRQFLSEVYWGKLDYLLIDTPPGTSDEHLTVVQALKSCRPDGAIIITTPQDVALSTIRKELNFCRKMKVAVLGLVENMSGFMCPCCGEVTDLWPNSAVSELCSEFDVRYLGKIPVDPSASAKHDEGGFLFHETTSLSTYAKGILDVVELLQV
eukprot:CFRG8146T1